MFFLPILYYKQISPSVVPLTGWKILGARASRAALGLSFSALRTKERARRARSQDLLTVSRRGSSINCSLSEMYKLQGRSGWRTAVLCVLEFGHLI